MSTQVTLFQADKAIIMFNRLSAIQKFEYATENVSGSHP